MASLRVVISDDRFGDQSEERMAFGGLDVDLVVAACRDEADMLAACAEADAVLVNQAPMTANVVAGLKRCRVISRYGIGYDNVDVGAATARGIWVANVPGYCTEEVAEHALGLLLCCVRRIPFKDRGVRSGAWNLNQPIRRMSGRTLGIIGFGSTGRAFWEKIQGFGFNRILVDDPRVQDKLLPGMFGQAAGFDEVIEQSDFISLHVPLKPETKHLIDASALSRMKRGVILINVARGPVVDEAALAAALASGKVAAAGLDVFEREPLPESSPLRAMDNVIMTDHSAYYSQESISVLKTRTALNARAVLDGGRPRDPVNAIG